MGAEVTSHQPESPRGQEQVLQEALVFLGELTFPQCVDPQHADKIREAMVVLAGHTNTVNLSVRVGIQKKMRRFAEQMENPVALGLVQYASFRGESGYSEKEELSWRLAQDPMALVRAEYAMDGHDSPLIAEVLNNEQALEIVASCRRRIDALRLVMMKSYDEHISDEFSDVLPTELEKQNAWNAYPVSAHQLAIQVLFEMERHGRSYDAITALPETFLQNITDVIHHIADTIRILEKTRETSEVFSGFVDTRTRIEEIKTTLETCRNFFERERDSILVRNRIIRVRDVMTKSDCTLPENQDALSMLREGLVSGTAMSEISFQEFVDFDMRKWFMSEMFLADITSLYVALQHNKYSFSLDNTLVQKILKAVNRLLADANLCIQEIEIGKTRFDATQHVGQAPYYSEKFPDGTIVSVVRGGLTDLGNKSIIPARVIVARSSQ